MSIESIEQRPCLVFRGEVVQLRCRLVLDSHLLFMYNGNDSILVEDCLLSKGLTCQLSGMSPDVQV